MVQLEPQGGGVWEAKRRRESNGVLEGAGNQGRAAGRATQRCGRTGGRRCLGPPGPHIPSGSARQSPHRRHCSAVYFRLLLTKIVSNGRFSSCVLAGTTAAEVRRCCGKS